LQEIAPETGNVRTDRGIRLAEPANTLIRVYEYGCGGEAIRGLDIAIEQMFRRNELWNRIVEIDNEVRTKMDATLFAGRTRKNSDPCERTSKNCGAVWQR